jgi:hypothetical protein
MSQHPESAPANPEEAFLSGAYGRIRRMTVVLAITGTIASAALFGWRSGLVVAIGALVAYFNLVWLHHGSEMMVDRMLAPAGQGPSKLRLMAAFTLRYVFVLTIAYVIFRGFPGMLIGFMIGLLLPILAATCEGVYEIAKIGTIAKS